MRLRNERRHERRSLYADDWVSDEEREDLGDKYAAALAAQRRIDAGRGRPPFQPAESDVVQNRGDPPAGGRRETDVAREIKAFQQACLEGRPLPWRDGVEPHEAWEPHEDDEGEDE